MTSETARLLELADFAVLDTAPEREFDELVEAAAEVAACPQALIGLIDESRQWFKARVGVEATQAPRDQTICQHVLGAEGPVVITDVGADPRFVDHPAVRGTPPVGFYAGFPLRTSSGAILGTLCVVDQVPRPDGLTDAQLRLLTVLASQVMTQLELRRSLAERDAAVRELGRVGELYRSLADHATDVVSQHAPDGTTLYVSPSVRDVLGYDPATEVGGSAPERIHPEDGPSMGAALTAVISGQPATAAVRSRHADGSYRHLEIQLSPIRDTHGAVIGIHSVARDVSERTAVQERLRLSERRYRVLFDANPVGQVELSPQGRIEGANRAFTELVGVADAAMLLGRTPAWATAEQDRPAQQETLRLAVASPGTVFHSARTIQHADGRSVEVAGTVVGVPGEDGAATMLIGSAVDVTARNQAERHLTELATELATARDDAVRRSVLTDTVLETVGVGIVACDAEGRLTLFNRATRAFHGMPPDPDADPLEWADRYALYAEDGRTALTREQIPLMRALTEGSVENAVIVVAPDGLPARVMRCDGRAMHDPTGRPLGAVVVMSDITQARSTAQALAEQADFNRVVLETAHTAIWSCDTTGRPTSVNATARDVLGWPALEVLHELHDSGRLATLADAVQMEHPDGRALAVEERPLRRALGGEDTGEIEVVLAAPGRARRVMLLRASPLRDVQGQPSGAILTGHDVTELRASEARFRAAFHDGPTPVARLDREGVVLEVNPALHRLLGHPDGAFVGDALTAHVMEEDRRRLRRVLAGPGTGAEPVEVRLQRAGGSVWCELATTVTTDSDGTVFVLAQFLDIAARKSQELALEEAARRDPLTDLGNRAQLHHHIQTVLDAGPEMTAGLLFLDLDGFKDVNDRYGHEAGDAVLVEVAGRLLAGVRPDDRVLRLGGDEFVVVCAVPTQQGHKPLLALAERLELAIAEPMRCGDDVLYVGGSVGAATSIPDQSPAQLVQAADRAMYRRKQDRRTGRADTPDGDRESAVS